MKRCYAKYLWKHKWEHVIGSCKKIAGCLVWERECSRCKLHQELCNTYGIIFLDKSEGGKPDFKWSDLWRKTSKTS